MITTFIILIGNTIFDLLLNVLPTSTALPQSLTDAINYISYSLNQVSYLIPVGHLFVALVIVLGFEAVMWGFFAFLWIWKRIPFLGK